MNRMQLNNQSPNRITKTLEAISQAVDWGEVLKFLETKSKEQNQIITLPQDQVLHNVKFIFLQHIYDLADVDLLELINDRISFKCFFGLAPHEPCQDNATSAAFREQLLENQLYTPLIDFTCNWLKQKGIFIDKGIISDVRVKIPEATQETAAAKDASSSEEAQLHLSYDTVQKMIRGDISQPLVHYALQMQLHQARKDVHNGSLSLDEATENLYKLSNLILQRKNPEGRSKATAARPAVQQLPQKVNHQLLKKLIRGEVHYQFKHYALQMQLHQAQKDVQEGQLSLNEAADNLYELCKRILGKKPARPSQATSHSAITETAPTTNKINHEALQKMIRGELKQHFKNHTLQMQLLQARKDVESGTCTIEEATNKLYDLCKQTLTPLSKPEASAESQNNKLPNVQRVEWKQLITGELEHEFRNYVLQVQLHQTKKDVRNGTVSVEQAVQNLYNLCSRFPLAVQTDFKQIFKAW